MFLLFFAYCGSTFLCCQFNSLYQLRSVKYKRVFIISKAMHKGYTIDQIHELTKIDKWFLQKLKHIIDIDERMKDAGNINNLSRELLREAKV